METLEALGKRISTTKDLRSIVRTMKSLSAVSIRQYEQSVIAIRGYSRTIDLGLQVLLRSQPQLAEDVEELDGTTAAIVFGSDHGLCGRFNEQMGGFVQDDLRRRGVPSDQRLLMAVGVQAAARLEALGERIEECFYLPGAVSGLTATAHSILARIEAWRVDHSLARVLVFHNFRSSEVVASPTMAQLLPLDPAWLRQIARRRWPSRMLPTYTMDDQALFASLVHEHLFVTIFRAGAESLASEHATRLASMQAAERNIQDHLEEMSGAFRHRRQQSITEELLDIVAGFEILMTAEAPDRNSH